jgi:hypothetical protein
VDVKEYEKAKPDIIAVKGAENILKVSDSPPFLILMYLIQSLVFI